MGSRLAPAALGVLVVAMVLYFVHVVTGVGMGWIDTHVYLVARIAAAVATGLQAERHQGRTRTGWRLAAAGLGVAALGDVVWRILYQAGGELPQPSAADGLYLSSYALLVSAALVLLVRPGSGGLSFRWLDGALCGLVASVVVLEVVGRKLSGGWDQLDPAVITNALYPFADLALLAAVVGALAAGHWRVTRSGFGLAVGAALLVGTDVSYLRQLADGVAVPSPWVPFGWMLSATAVAVASFLPSAARHDEDALPPRRALAMPVLAGVAGVAVLVLGTSADPWAPTLAVATAIVCLSFVRFAATAAENRALLASASHEAVTDSLTGLRNRRALLRDLAALPGPRTLAVFDLDGFKLYNDTFGHPAGDVLLRMVGQALADAAGPDGRVYRLGGDEYCALVDGDHDLDGLGHRLSQAMRHAGDGFTIGASFGAVRLPGEASTPAEALAVADRRLYIRKNGRRGSTSQQSADVLLAVLAERTPDLSDHVTAVGDLAEAVAEQLGLEDAQRQEVRHAAALHDIGKIAIPEHVLHKPGPLDDDEWRLMRQHTVIGERVLSAAPALSAVGRLVRASHERWDGGGYPDGLRGDGIPLGSRIILACDAYDAMTSQRPYGSTMSPMAAEAELRRSAGTQLDPDVVVALCAVLATRRTRRLAAV